MSANNDLASILFKAQSRIEHAKQQQALLQPLAVPKLSDEEDDESSGKQEATNDVSSWKLHLAPQSNSAQQSNSSQSNSDKEVNVITAAEAYRILTGICEFKTLLQACEKYIIDSIDECKNLVIYHIANMISTEDLKLFICTLENNLYSVSDNVGGSITIRWHNKSTQQKTVKEMKHFAALLTTNLNSEKHTTMFNAYEACLREIERDENYVQGKMIELQKLIQQDIQLCLKNKNPNHYFIFEVPIGKLLGFSTNRQYHLQLLEKAFVQVIHIVSEKWKYKVSDIENSSTRMKFKLAFPGFNAATHAKSSQSSSSGGKTLSSAISAFSNNYSGRSSNSESFSNLVQNDLSAQLKQLKVGKIERQVKNLFSQSLLVMQQWWTLTHLLKQEPRNQETYQRFELVNQELEQIQTAMLNLILEQ